MKYRRLVDLSKYSSSAFVFGLRMTGKTSLLRIPTIIASMRVTRPEKTEDGILILLWKDAMTTMIERL